ncbi:hypothetical protein NB037_01185 [Rathayibacter sp. ZW T2_19]|uniref:Uncharacterized protein n=1 Tax=Rathayibacter rubneri TaxID=2950106 RepID=A0A9X2DV29_9MICO|nr:hypothetical protein [Rathayibacter rubneri]MCM6761019.1 hypothetical protein [Rathayibacter rubneri]
MPRPQTRTVLRTLVDVLADPAPINAGHARHVAELIEDVLEEDVHTGSTPAALAAIVLEDESVEDPAL